MNKKQITKQAVINEIDKDTLVRSFTMYADIMIHKNKEKAFKPIMKAVEEIMNYYERKFQISSVGRAVDC